MVWCGAQGVGGRVSGEPGAATANTVGTHTPGTKVHQPPRVCVAWWCGLAVCVSEWQKEWAHGQEEDRDWDWVVKRGGWVVKD